MSDIYASRGYGSEAVGFGEKPALLVVDFQRGFTDPSMPMGGAPMVDAAVDNTVRLMRAAKAAGALTIACVNGYYSRAAVPRWKAAPVYDLLAGTESVELDPRIAAEQPDVVLMKGAPSIFFATPCAAILARHGIDTTIVTGCITSGCIRASVIDAFSHGFRVIVPHDAVGDHTQQAHDQNLADVGRRYADIMDTDGVIAALTQRNH